jgi:hypothetical protein
MTQLLRVLKSREKITRKQRLPQSAR